MGATHAINNIYKLKVFRIIIFIKITKRPSLHESAQW